MKQLFLKSLLWTVQTAGRAAVGLIRFLTWTPTMVVLLGLNLLNIANGQAVILNTVAATVLTLALASKFIARQSSAPTEAAQDTRVQDATQARDEAAAALQAEAQAVVDRIRERTISVSVDTKALSTDLNQIEADYKDGRLTAHEAATKIVAATKKSRSVKATLTDASGTVVPLKPARKRKPKGGDQ